MVLRWLEAALFAEVDGARVVAIPAVELVLAVGEEEPVLVGLERCRTEGRLLARAGLSHRCVYH